MSSARGRRGSFASTNRDYSLNEEIVSKIKERINKGEPIKDIAKDTGVKYCIIYNIRKGYAWRYVEPQISITQEQSLKGKIYSTPDIPTTCSKEGVPSGWGYIIKK